MVLDHQNVFVDLAQHFPEEIAASVDLGDDRIDLKVVKRLDLRPHRLKGGARLSVRR